MSAAWDPSEDSVLISAYVEHGLDWIGISRQLAGRTPAEVRRRALELVDILCMYRVRPLDAAVCDESEPDSPARRAEMSRALRAQIQQFETVRRNYPSHRYVLIRGQGAYTDKLTPADENFQRVLGVALAQHVRELNNANNIAARVRPGEILEFVGLLTSSPLLRTKKLLRVDAVHAYEDANEVRMTDAGGNDQKARWIVSNAMRAIPTRCQTVSTKRLFGATRSEHVPLRKLLMIDGQCPMWIERITRSMYTLEYPRETEVGSTSLFSHRTEPDPDPERRVDRRDAASAAAAADVAATDEEEQEERVVVSDSEEGDDTCAAAAGTTTLPKTGTTAVRRCVHGATEGGSGSGSGGGAAHPCSDEDEDDANDIEVVAGLVLLVREEDEDAGDAAYIPNPLLMHVPAHIMDLRSILTAMSIEERQRLVQFTPREMAAILGISQGDAVSLAERGALFSLVPKPLTNALPNAAASRIRFSMQINALFESKWRGRAGARGVRSPSEFSQTRRRRRGCRICGAEQTAYRGLYCATCIDTLQKYIVVIRNENGTLSAAAFCYSCSPKLGMRCVSTFDFGTHARRSFVFLKGKCVCHHNKP